MTLPSKELLTQIRQYILSRPNKPEESKKAVHYGLFLLCSEAGLRVSEAVNFDLANKTEQGLYKITPTKKRQARYVYISPLVIKELKKNNWQPNQTNRFNFYHFLKQVKQELNIPPQIELTPHTLRRCFATYWANAGIPLPLLSKLLGHASIRTTALYWLNIYAEPEQNIKPPNDVGDILLGKEWIKKHENKEPSQPQPIPETMPELIAEPTIKPPKNIPENLAEFSPLEPEPNQVEILPLINSKPQSEKEAPQNKPTEPKPQEKPTEILVESKQTEVSEPLEPSELNQEQVLLKKVQQLTEQLKQVQAENEKLKQELAQTEASAQHEKARADYYESQLKAIARGLYQWQKISYYQQLEQEAKAEQKCYIVQAEKPPPFRSGK